MMKGRLIALGLAAWVMAIPAVAHHSFDGSFDRNKPITLSGTVTAFNLTEPHAYFILSVAEADGKMKTWHIETTSGRRLTAQGWTPQSVKAGEKLSVQGWPARDGKAYMRLQSMTHADGSTLNLWLPAGPTPLARN